MKKNLLILTGIVTSLTITSCLKDEIKEVNKGREIGFQSAVQTKGVETTWSTMKTFYVTALEAGTNTPYFQNVPFSQIGSAYNSTPAYYWPGGNAAMDFYAYYPSTQELGCTLKVEKDGMSLENFAPKTKIEEQMDFVTAATLNKTEADQVASGLPIKFQHHLARVSINASVSYNNAYSYKIAGVKLGNIKSEGDFGLTVTTTTATDENTGEETVTTTQSASWTNVETSNNHVYEYTTDEVVPISLTSSALNLLGELSYDDSDDTKTNYAFLLPQNITPWNPETETIDDTDGAYISLYMQTNTAEGVRVFPAEGDYEWVYVPLSVPKPNGAAEDWTPKWEAGYAYHYSIEFKKGAGYSEDGNQVLGEAVKVTMNIDDWADAADESMVNKDLIGRWVAYKMVNEETDYYYSWIENQKIYDTEPTCTTYTYEGADIKIDGFSEVKVINGKKLKITQNGYEVETDFIINAENQFLIDTYKNDDGTYQVYPTIKEITPVNGSQNGSATIEVVQTSGDLITPTEGKPYYQYTTVQTLYYTIYPLE